ncbi:MAG TPA: transglutaminase domain-containing protein [bacterium]|nr:transglutaminase domain-containing protein [bacterium]
MRKYSLNRKYFQKYLKLGGLFIIISFIAAYFYSSKSRAHTSYATREMQFSYAFTVKNIPPEAKHVDIWAPVPQSDSRQNISNLEIRCDYPYSFEIGPEYQNPLLKVAANGSIPESLSVSMNFSVTRTAYHFLKEKDQPSATISEKARRRFLAPDHLVPIDGRIADEAKKVVRDDMTPLEKARAIYDHVAGTVTYDKSGAGWGRGDAVYACDARSGNCTDFHSLFIGMARASAIAARFVMGFPVPEGATEGNIPGYHCWAEFYIDGMGWLPIDASEASKHPEKWDDFFGGLDPHRIQFTIGRDIRIPSMGQSEPLNYFVYPYVLIDGKPHDDVQRHIRFSELK